MKFEIVNYPLNKPLYYRRTKVQEKLLEFLNMNVPIVKCVFDEGEYVSVSSAASTYKKSIHRYGYPIIVSTINKEMYLIRKDIENV